MLVVIAYVLLAGISASAVELHSHQQEYARHVWHTEDGLPEETVQAFAQTPDHFLWIGTSGGLVRFDGAQFVVFNRDNIAAFRENSVFCLLTSANGTLWVGTEGGGLLSYSDGVFRAWSKDDGLTNGYVRALRQDQAGDIWIGTDDGLFRLRGQKIQRVDGRNGIPLSSIHAIYIDQQQRLWAGGYHFFVLSHGNATEVALPGGLSDNVKSIIQTRDGTVWVGTVSGLEKMNPQASGFQFRRVPGIHSTVRTLLEDGERCLWIGTIGEGLIRYQNGKFSRLPAESKPPSNTVLSSFLGNEKNIWIGTQTGLVRLNKTAVSTLSLPDFADADFGTIYRDRDGALWVGSSHLFRITGQRVEIPKFPAPLGGTRVRTVFRDTTGTLWLGTEGKGVFRWHNGALDSIPGIQPYVRAFAEDQQGGIWIGTDGGYCRWTPRETKYFELHESVRALLVDRNGDVWVGKDRGLTRLRHGDFVPDVPIPRLQTEKVWAIHEDPQGGLWFGTRSSGVFWFKGGRLTSYTTAQGLSSNSIYQILEDRGTLWISGPNGVSSIARKDLEAVKRDPSYRPSVKLYGTSDGLETTQMYGGVQPAGCMTSSGEVWFPSTAGPVRIGLDPDLPVPVPPPVIYQVVADGRDVRTSGNVDLRPGLGRLEI
ncbi:MAG: two-component regulator propeller domain-containing protein, partial [Bryobacteraceae bacterium]